MKVMGKGLRLAIFLVVFIVVEVVIAYVAGDALGSEYNDVIMCGSFCFVGSALFVLAYDTFYKDRGGKKGFLQKVFTLIGFIIMAVFGIVGQVSYYQNFEVSQNYSPFLYALCAPWLMSGLLTLLLYEVKFKNSNGLLKIALPFISLIVCYIIYVILGFAGGSSAFVYAGIGSVICAILAVVLLGFLKVLGRLPKNSGSSESANSSSGEEGMVVHPSSFKHYDGSFNSSEYRRALERYLKNYFERDYNGNFCLQDYASNHHYEYDRYVHGKEIFSASVKVEFTCSNTLIEHNSLLQDNDNCNVHVELSVDMDKLREEFSDKDNYVNTLGMEAEIKRVQDSIKVGYEKLVKDLPQQFSDYRFKLVLNTKEK